MQYGSGISRSASGGPSTWSRFRPHRGRSSISEGRLPGDGALLADPARQGPADAGLLVERLEGLAGAGGVGTGLPAIGAARDRARGAVLARVGRVGPSLDVLQGLLGRRGGDAASAGFLSPEGLAARVVVGCAGRRGAPGSADAGPERAACVEQRPPGARRLEGGELGGGGDEPSVRDSAGG